MKQKILLSIFVGIYISLFVITFFPRFKYMFYTSQQIKESDIKLHLRYISDDSQEGRYSGSNGSKNVQDWIINFYQLWNLYPLFDGSYRQTFSFKGNYQKIRENYIQRLGCDDCKIPIEPLPLGSYGSFKGKILLGGYCIEEKKELSNLLQKYNIKNPSEYILICNRYGDPKYSKENPKEYNQWITFEQKFSHIERWGFLGVIFLRDEGEKIQASNFYLKKNKESKTFSAFLDNVSYKDLFKQYIDNNFTEVQIKIEYKQEELNGNNLGASLKPFDKNQKVIYIGAHYDHLGKGIPQFSLGPMGEIYNGADDNASGTSGVLELAEYFSKNKNDLLLPDDWNIVFLLFDGEEWGLLGSNHFVNSTYFSPNSIAMFNFDMIGRYKKNLQIQGIQTGDSIWQNIIKKEVQSYTDKLNIQWIDGGTGPSDHTVFYRKKIPVLFFFTGTHEDYHKPSDDYHKINYKAMEDIVQLAKNIIVAIIKERHIPQYQYVKEKEQNNYQFKVRLGIIPGNYFSDEGIEVAGFVENAPIKHSGIKEGDIIIKIEQYEIKNIYDLMEFLSKAQLGKKYRIFYKRNNKIFETQSELMGQ
jgi:hypothetical protein